MSQIALIDAGGANLGSVRYVLERLGAEIRIVRHPDELAGVSRVILPGVGMAATAMQRLQQQGLVAALQNLKVPLLGICLGMQLLYEHSEEGDVNCLGLLKGQVKRMLPLPGIRIPHMGWNQLSILKKDSPLLAGVTERASAYFVHSYAVPVGAYTVASCEHGVKFSAAVQEGNYYGAQFHPERSAEIGTQILHNFIALESV